MKPEFNIKKNALTKETLYEAYLPTGQKLIVIPKKGFTKQFAMYAADYGSNNIEFCPVGEDKPVKVPLGIAHFLEHKMFDNENGQNVFELFAKYGAQPNAFTSYDMTAYYFDCTEAFYDNLHILIDYVNNPYFTAESVEKEKGIISQEITMYDDDPDWALISAFLKAIYHFNPVRNDIAGDVESITSITNDLLYLCYNNFYNPGNMVLAVGGDVDPYTVYEKASEFCSEDKRSLRTGKVKKISPAEPESIVTHFSESRMDISRPKMIFGWKDKAPGIKGKALLRKRLSLQIALELFSGRSSKLYNKLYDDQIIDDSFDFSCEATSDYAYAYFAAETDEYEKLTEELKKEIALTKASGFDMREFERVKKCYIGSLVTSFDRVAGIVHSLVRQHFAGIDIFDYYEVLDSISLEDITEEFSRSFDEEHTALCVIRPSSENEQK